MVRSLGVGEISYQSTYLVMLLAMELSSKVNLLCELVRFGFFFHIDCVVGLLFLMEAGYDCMVIW